MMMNNMAKNSEYLFLYTADVHGNRYQTLSALLKALYLGLEGVVFGGDIAFKEGNKEDGPHWKLGHKTRNPEAQKKYYENFMIPLFEDFTASTGIDIYLMMGNDDFRINMPILEQANKEGKFKLLHEQPHKLPNGLFIVGDSHIDLTPFVNKDWEKWDLTSESTEIKKPGIRYNGFSSTDKGFSNYCIQVEGYYKVDFNKIPHTDSLEAHLFSVIRHLSDPQKTIYVFHAPPYFTHIDLMQDEHAGSLAVRRYFEQVGGLLGLHGHIHGAVDDSGHFLDKVGSTIVAAAGNNPYNFPTNYYTDYSRTLHALIVSASEARQRVERVAVEFDTIDSSKIPQRISKYLKELES